MIKLIIFDMAGTAVNENNTVYKTIQATLMANGYEVTLDQVLIYAAGKEKLQAIKDVLKSLGIVLKIEEVITLYSQFQSALQLAYEAAPISLFDSAKEIILHARAKGIKVAFNTGYKREMAEFLLLKTKTEVGKHIDLLVASDDVTLGRPHPDMILKVCEDLGILPNETIKVGDSVIDIEEGINANVAMSIGVTTGAHTRLQLESAGAVTVIDDLIALKKYI